MVKTQYVINPVLLTVLNCEIGAGIKPDPFLKILRGAPPNMVVKSGKMRGITPENLKLLLAPASNANGEFTPAEPVVVDDGEQDDGAPKTAAEGLAKLGVKKAVRS